ncbi:MAG: VOC family protein [Acidobacteria bacterium]|nr:VOC family protein [Acidobacteriota bacterium]
MAPQAGKEAFAVGVSLSANATATPDGMQLGMSVIRIAVQDLKASEEFYLKLGFTREVWSSTGRIIMKNGEITIFLSVAAVGFDQIITIDFSSAGNGTELAESTDIREFQKQLKAKGIQPKIETDETTKGPAEFVVVDPDGNQILFTQR